MTDNRTPLHGHTSPETAMVVEDYPYGFRLRCRIRYWLETHPRHGVRFVSQTTNPKIEGREVWNKPKASTYCAVAGGMYLDGDGHATWTGIGHGDGPAAVAAFLADWPECRALPTVRAHAIYNGRMAVAFALAAEKGQSGFAINGVPTPCHAGDLERHRADADAWRAILATLPKTATEAA